MFIAIVVPQARQEKPVLLSVALALIFSCLFTWVPGLNSVSAGLAIVICTVAAAAICALVAPVDEEVAQ
jgi:predicted branched-subunit amino acid permease